MLVFVVVPVDVRVCELREHTHIYTHTQARFAEIKVIISLEALLLYVHHYHILIDHKDDVSCLQLGKNVEAPFFFFPPVSACCLCFNIHSP